MKERRFVIAVVFDALIILSALSGILLNVFDIRFMADAGRLSETPFFVTFTGLSNVFVLLVGLLCLIIRLVQRKTTLPIWAFIIRMTSCACILLTFLVTAVYLTPSVGSLWWRLYINGSLFNHLVTPLLSILGFILVEEKRSLRYPVCLYSLIPIGCYGVFYCIRAFPHVDPGQPTDLYYDIYGLCRAGIPVAILLLFAFMGAVLGFTSLLYLQNRMKKPIS